MGSIDFGASLACSVMQCLAPKADKLSDSERVVYEAALARLKSLFEEKPCCSGQPVV